MARGKFGGDHTVVSCTKTQEIKEGCRVNGEFDTEIWKRKMRRIHRKDNDDQEAAKGGVLCVGRRWRRFRHRTSERHTALTAIYQADDRPRRSVLGTAGVHIENGDGRDRKQTPGAKCVTFRRHVWERRTISYSRKSQMGFTASITVNAFRAQNCRGNM